MDTGGRWPMEASGRTQGLAESSSTSFLGPSVPYAEKAGTLLPADPNGCSKVNRASHDDDSPLSPPMAWSREGTSEELSKYQELQMRQQNDGHQHRTQDSGIPTTSSNLAQPAKERLAGLVANADSDRTLRGSPRQEKRTSHLESSSNSWSRSVEASAENGQDSRRSTAHSAMDSTPTRTPKSGRIRIKAKAAEDGDSSTPRSSARSDRPRSYSNPHCQRQHSSGSTTKKTRCYCQSCQLDNAIITPPQRPYRYGQFLGSGIGGGSDPIPIYAGPLGLGDDIPSPTPSPPPPGRLSIHMAMSGQSPLGSPSSSPLFSLSHPFLTTSPPSNRPPGTKTRTSSRSGNGSASEKRGLSLGFSPTVANHPIVTGFQCQLQEPKSRGSKREAEGDTSPSLSPFFSSKRSFSPPKNHLSPTAALSTSPPMPAETLHAHRLLHEGASTSGEKHSNLLSHGTSDANPHFPRLAPPVVLVQSPTSESLSTVSEQSPKKDQQRADSSPLLYSSVLASSTPSSTSASTSTSTSTSSPLPSVSPGSPHFSNIPRSPQQPLSPSGRSGAAATPPVSPSRKKEGYHPTLSSIEQKEFEAWSLTEQIQDRVVRTSPQLQYKSALLSGVGNKTLPSEQSRLQQQPAHSRQQKYSPDTQQNSPHQHPHQNHHPRSHSTQHQTQQQHQQHHQPRSNSPAGRYNQRPANNNNNTSRDLESARQKWHSNGHHGPVKEGVFNRASGNGWASPRRSQSPVRGGHAHVHAHVHARRPHENSTTAPETRTPANGSSLNVLRRSRSAPTLASGQLSYADILKASIKATSAPSLPTGSSGYVSLPSLESSPAVSPHPSPIASSSSSSGSSPQVMLSNPSSAELGNQRSRWTVSLTPTRTMKPLGRLVLKNSKSDNNLRDRIDKAQMSAPMRSLLPSFQPISAGAGAGSGVGTGSNSSSHGEECGQVETKDCADHSRKTELEHRKEVLSKGAVDTMELSEKEAEVEETIVPRAMSVQQGKVPGGTESVEALRDSNASASTATSTATATGLSFFRPPEELDELESSPETVRHAQNIVAVSMLKFEHQEDSTNASEDGSKRRQSKDSDGSIGNTLVPLGEKSSILEHASAFLVERKKDAPAAAAAWDDEQEDDRQVDLSETLQSTSQKCDDGRPWAATSISDPTNSECPFQKQLALQEQEQLQVGTQAQEVLDDISSRQSKTATATETAIATTTTTTTRGERLKQRRRRNNSSGGKKILPKKKTSVTNLHSNVVQTLQQQKQSSLKAEDDNASVENATTSSDAPATEDHIIPPFYFPMGRPLTASKRRQKVLNALAKAREVFAAAENEVLNEAGFVAVTVQCCELPRYMNRALFRKVGVAGNNEVRFSELELAWESLAEGCPDEISMIFMILKQPNKNVLTPTDFEVVLQDLVLFHPGLEFLSGNAVFQERYLETVITRIFYEANRRHGKMSLADLRRSQFDKTLRKLENSDLNQTEDCFSYKHFYVIYCKFWELDQDHDLILDEQDLAGYSGGAISSRIIRRVMQGYGNETGMFMVPDQELLLQQQQQQQQQLMLMQQRQLQQQDLDLELELENNQEREQEPEHGQSAEQQPVPSSSEDETQQSSVTKSLEHPENTPSADGSKATLETVEASLDGSPLQQPKALRRSMTLSSVDLASIESADHATTTFNQTDTDIEMSSECDMVTSAADTATTTATSPLTATTAWTAAAAAATAAAAAATTTPFVRTTPPGPGSQCHPQNYRMTYKGFIWFLLAETDKQTTTSIEYWFRCMDLDGDGMLTVFELEQLFQEQATRMAILGMESFGFRDAICQMQDLVSPKEPGLVRLTDLKQCGQAGPFIDLFCNVVRWRSFEAHQHQIRMRQQQIAMQRAADAAWEEGEKLFNSVVDDDDDEEEGDDSDQDRDEDAGSGEDCNNEDDDHSVSDQDEHEGDSVSEADEEGDESCSVESDDADGRLLNSTAGDETPMAKVAEGQQQDALSSPMAVAAAASVKQKALKRRRRVQEKRQRKQQRQQQRQEQMLMKRVLLEEQRKEKALLATIRESPWIVYVESEYEKLVTIERPQSRTEWDQEEDDDEEEEDEEMEEEEEEEEVMDEEDMMMEEGRESSAASLQHQQHLQLQHQQFLLQQQQQLRLEQEQQLQLHQLQEGFSSQIEADVVLSDGDVGSVNESTKTPSHDSSSHKLTVGTGTLMEVGQDFEQISMDSHSMETNGAGVVAIGDVA